ncbi:MAG: DUF4124 domain-containing protein [Pseudomonadales bacterium]|nr:DUF4124 domain-containing protein [Pseudomonadales bacterium]
MKTFTLGILIAVLAFVAYPKRQAILCLALPEHETCQPVAAPVVIDTEIVEPEPRPPQKVFKWTDDQGVVHYGEQDVGGAERIDEDLQELTVLSGGKDAMARNKSATSQLGASTYRKSRSYTSASSKSYKQSAKKKRCASLAGKRDAYSMKDPMYKRYSTQYGQECIF